MVSPLSGNASDEEGVFAKQFGFEPEGVQPRKPLFEFRSFLRGKMYCFGHEKGLGSSDRRRSRICQAVSQALIADAFVGCMLIDADQFMAGIIDNVGIEQGADEAPFVKRMMKGTWVDGVLHGSRTTDG